MSKNFIVLLALLALVSCKKETPKNTEATTEVSEDYDPVAFGREIFETKGNCASCHKPDQKVIGPSILDIAKIYKEQNGDIVAFLKGKAEPIVDPSQYEVMKTNFAITKSMTDEQLKALEAYFYSHLKK